VSSAVVVEADQPGKAGAHSWLLLKSWPLRSPSRQSRGFARQASAATLASGEGALVACSGQLRGPLPRKAGRPSCPRPAEPRAQLRVTQQAL
jgi:hypothetical protein